MSIISDRLARGWGRAALLVAIGMVSAFAQFTDFQGGKLYLNMEGNMSPFGLGSNTGARGAMGNVTAMYPSASSMFGNPAALAFLQGISVQTDFFLPGLGLGVSSERTKLLRNNMKVPIQDFLDTDQNRVEHPVYPDVSLGLYQSTNLGGFAVAFGGPSATLSAGVQQPFRGKIDFGLGGMRIGLGLPEDENDPESDSIKVLLSGDAFAHFTAEMNDFSLGLAGMPWPEVRLGVAYQRYTIDMLLEAGARVDGILQRAGQDNYFHGDGVNYHNDLDARGAGQVHGSAHGIRVGADWQFSKHFGLDAMISMAEVMRLQGALGWDYNTVPFLDFESDKIMNTTLMNPTKLTLTTRTRTEIQNMKVNLPWEGAVSVHTNWENFRMNLDYSYFMRGMSVLYTSIESADAFDTTTKDLYKNSFGYDSVTLKETSNRFRLGLQQQFALGVQAYQVFFQIGGIVYTVENDDLLSESVAYRPSWLPFIPTMNTGYFFPLGPNLTVTVSLVAFPVSLFKTTVEYRY